MEEQHSEGESSIERASAGLQAGTIAGFAMLGWIMLGAWVQGQSFWTIPNLLAYTFYGNRMYRPDFIWRTWSGLGLHFFFSLLLGVAFAFLIPSRLKPRPAAMAGILYSLALYVAAAIWFWDRFNPPLALYSRQRFVVIGYILFGIGLGTLPLFSSTGGRSPVYNSAANVNSYTE